MIKCSISNQITDEETLRALTPESGRIYELTLEEQAQYARCFLIPMFGMPDKDDLPESTVKEKADQFFAENESIAQDELDRLIKYTSFVINGKETASYPIWGVVYVDAELDRPIYHVFISATTGELISIEIMDWEAWGLAETVFCMNERMSVSCEWGSQTLEPPEKMVRPLFSPLCNLGKKIPLPATVCSRSKANI